METFQQNLPKLKIDRTKLRTVANYAKIIDVTPMTVYRKIKAKEVKSEVIDGVTFVVLP